MKVSIIGTLGIPACYGGFETLAENLVKYNNKKCKYKIICSGKKKKENNYENTELIYIPIPGNGLYSIVYDLIGMIKSLDSDIMLILGVSGAIFIPVIKAFYRGKIVVNIDGLEWKRQKWNSIIKSYLRYSEKIAIKYANKIIVDNIEIQRYVLNNYRKNSILIEYGGDNLINVDKDKCINYRYALCVCRIEPENNISIILKTFSENREYNIKIIGNWNNNKYSRTLKEKYSKYKNIEILNPIYNLNVLNKIRKNANIYIHGHSAGGTNPSLVEAMNLKLPILAYDVVYNRETTENLCWYFNDSVSLANLLKTITEEEKILCGEVMGEIAKRRYKWEKIEEKYYNTYKECLINYSK